MSGDFQTRTRRAGRPPGHQRPERRPAARAAAIGAAVGRFAARDRNPRAGRARRDGRGARPLRRAGRTLTSGARHASPTSTSATRRDADEAVQDAFVKVFSHIGSYREAWPFEVWFTRILINGCLDRRKARSRRDRWFVGGEVSNARRSARRRRRRRSSDPEHRLLARERRARHRRGRSTGSTAGSGRSSCCATTATARRGRSAP